MRKQVVISWGLYWVCDHLGTASDLVKTVSNSLHEFSGGNIVFRAHTIEINISHRSSKKEYNKDLLLAMDGKSQILGHDVVVFYSADTCLFQMTAESSELLIVIKTSTVSQTTRPSENGSNGIGRSRVTLKELNS